MFGFRVEAQGTKLGLAVEGVQGFVFGFGAFIFTAGRGTIWFQGLRGRRCHDARFLRDLGTPFSGVPC